MKMIDDNGEEMPLSNAERVLKKQEITRQVNEAIRRVV